LQATINNLFPNSQNFTINYGADAEDVNDWHSLGLDDSFDEWHFG
jgi:hypothetical protein